MSSDSTLPAGGPDSPSTPRSGANFSARSMPTTGSVSLKKVEAPTEAPKPAVDKPAEKARLPPLPLPKLEQTCRRFCEVVAGVLTPEELETAKEEVEAFRLGDGARLDAILQEWKPEEGNRSYIERYWHQSYLKGRDPLVVNVNPFFVLEEDPTPSRNSQIERATSLIISCLKFHQAVITGTLEDDSQRGQPLCMSQYHHLFHAARIPDAKCDYVERFPDSRHIAVMCRGQIYWFNVYAEDGRSCLPAEEIASNLRLIRDDSWNSGLTHAEAMRSAVGVLTTEDRTVWARVRETISLGDGIDTAGSDSLFVMDSALFVVCLDHVSPHTLADQSNDFLHGTSSVESGVQTGTCLNRWYDKSLQIIVCENGSAGVNFEHSHLDGHTVLRFASDVFTDTILRFAQTIRGALPSLMGTLPDVKHTTTIDSTPRKIVWRLSPEVVHSIRRAEAKLSDLINRTEVECLEFTGFGKSSIVDVKCSPDAFIQLAFQLAYYRLYGELRMTYETVMTKMFDHGRTEAQRSCTPEAYAFVRAFCSDAPVSKKVEAFMLAMKAQGHGVKLCSDGMGADRHLFALKSLAEERGEAIPAFFSTKAYRLLGHNVLSTSNCGNPSLRLFGFGPVVADGFGIGYLIKNDGVQFCVSSFRRQTMRFLELLQMSMHDIRTLLLSDKPKDKPTNRLPAGSVSLGPAKPAAPSPSGSAGVVSPIPRALSRQQTFTRMAVSPPQPPASAEISPVANVMYQVWTDMLSHSSNRIASVATIASTAGISVPDISLLDAAGDVSVELSRWLQAAAETYSRRTNHA